MTAMEVPPYLRATREGVVLSVKAQPRASRTELAGVHGDELKVRVAAPPVDSAANEALVEFLAAALGCPRRDVQLVRGGKSPHKQFVIAGVPLETVARRLAM